MRAIEAAAIASGRVTALDLMERAGEGIVAAVLARWPALAARPGRAVVLCGPGNNGGDGFVVARLLAARGWDVRALFWGRRDRLSPEAIEAWRAWAAAGRIVELGHGVVPRWFWDHDPPHDGLGPGDLVVDALFGIGLTRPATDLLRVFQRYAPPVGRRWHVVAVDVPSGIDADTGRPPPGDAGGTALPLHAFADLTVTFHASKPCHVAEPGRGICGEVAVADIGLGPRAGAA
jgi:hydroxyethylthiazole kinase-like uncharacterized protein yjeF